MDITPPPQPRARRNFKRFDMRRILSCPKTRRLMVARGTVATQAREGIDITLEQALESYDALEQSGELTRVRRLAAEWPLRSAPTPQTR